MGSSQGVPARLTATGTGVGAGVGLGVTTHLSCISGCPKTPVTLFYSLYNKFPDFFTKIGFLKKVEYLLTVHVKHYEVIFKIFIVTA